MTQHITVSIKQAKEMIVDTIKAKLVPLLSGSPGGGKSAIVAEIAKEFNLKMIDLRLAQCDPTDLLGFPTIDKDRQKACYMPMSTFPVEGDPIPEGYNGWLLFCDEFTSADPGVQKAAYKLILDKMIGEFHLHPNCAIVCAGNLATDNAIVEEMSTALQSRLVHMELTLNSKEWLDWAASSHLDPRITGFINFKPGNLYTFSPDHSDKTYASPRTWEFADRILKVSKPDSNVLLPLLAGTISEGVAREFMGFMKIYADLPTIQELENDPEGMPVPGEPSVLFALTGSIAHNIDSSNAGKLIKFVNRMPMEFQVVCLRESVRRDNDILKVSAIVDWIDKNSFELM